MTYIKMFNLVSIILLLVWPFSHGSFHDTKENYFRTKTIVCCWIDSIMKVKAQIFFISRGIITTMAVQTEDHISLSLIQLSTLI